MCYYYYVLAKVNSGAIVGLDSVSVLVEVDVSSKSLPSFQIVGLADKAVEESKERVRSAIKNSGLDFPKHKITVNLAPADLPKEGAVYDLPIALGILLANESIKASVDDSLFIGELSLDGSLRSVPGVLSLVLMARDLKLKNVFLPEINSREASVVSGINIYPVRNLGELAHHLSDIEKISPAVFESLDFSTTEEFESDFRDVKGQELAKRAMEIVAAGGHNILLRGSPGSGKTLLARTFSSIVPNLTEDEAIEISKIYSVNGLLPSGTALIKKRPFRSPHHTTSHVGLIGGGTHPKPGEISLAHRGTLFLDEFPEFPRHVLEALRQPLEDGYVTVSRAAGTCKFPAKFTLIAACNPCPCGNFGSKNKCICTTNQILAYKKRLSGPLIDRIDLHVFCSQIPAEKLTSIESGESSSEIRKRVQKARDIQNKRYKDVGINYNAELSASLVKQFCKLDEECLVLMKQAITSMGLSGRGFHRLLKVSRTIADLDEAENIQVGHLSEALQFRSRED